MSGVISLDSFRRLSQSNADDDRIVPRDGSLFKDRQITLCSDGIGVRSVERQQNRAAREAFLVALKTENPNSARFMLGINNTPLTSRMVRRALDEPGRVIVERSQEMGAKYGLSPEDSIFFQQYKGKYDEAREVLKTKLEEKRIKLSDEDMKSLLKPLAKELNRMMTLVARGAYETGTLQECCEKFTLESLDRFPGLTGMIDTRCTFFTQNITKMLDRFTAHKEGIGQAIFGGKDIGKPTGIHVTDSDPHHGGQQVCIVTFSSGEKLVYKPRDCRIDSMITGDKDSFAAVLNAAEGGDRPLIPTYKYYAPNENFGFVQYLPHGEKDRTIKSDEDIKSYYTDMGRLTGLAWLAGATDLHQGNVICSGLRPHLTDLEMAFQEMPVFTENDLYLAASKETQLSMALEHNSGYGMTQVQVDEGELGLNPFFQVTDHLLMKDNEEIMKSNSSIESEGFMAVINLAKKADVQTQLAALCEKAAEEGYQVRRHPVGTGKQSEWLDGLYLASDKPRVDAVREFLSSHDQVPQTLANYFAASYQVGDIPYFAVNVGDGSQTYIGVDINEPYGFLEMSPRREIQSRIESLVAST